MIITVGGRFSGRLDLKFFKGLNYVNYSINEFGGLCYTTIFAG